MLKSDTDHWGSLARFFHWTIVLLIIVQGTIGLVMVDMPKTPRVIPVFSFHKSLGLTILALAVLRLGWRALDRRPAEPATMPRWQVSAAHIGHALLYVLLFAVPLSGWWFDSVSALRPLYWFGLFEVPHLTGPDQSLKDLAAATHEALFWLLVTVAAGHAVIALIHQFVVRDNVLGRMWPASLQRKSRSSSLPETTDASSTPRVAAGAAAPDFIARDRP
jgi:cytochrome b561